MKKYLLGLALASAALFCAAPAAQAALQLRLTQGVNVVTIVDNANTGAVTFNGSIGTYTLTVDTAQSKPLLGTAASPHMDLTFVANGVGTLTIEAWDNGFTTSPAGVFTNIGGTVSTSNAGNTVTYQSFTGVNGTPFDTSGNSSALLTRGPGAFSAVVPMSITVPAPYSIEQKVVITHLTSGVSSGDADLQAVPAPAGLVLLAVGAPFLAVGYYRRKKAAVPA